MILNKFYILLLLIFPIIGLSNPGGQLIADLNQRIDELQYEFDSLDGLADGKINVSGAEQSRRATQLYITNINELQRQINDKDQAWMKSRDELREIKNWLVDTHPQNYTSTEAMDQMEIKYCLFTNTRMDWVRSKLENNDALAMRMYSTYEHLGFSDSVINSMYNSNPELFLRNIGYYGNSPEVYRLIDQMVHDNPINMVQWVDSNTDVNRILQQSTSPTTRLMIDLFRSYGRASKSFYLMNDILAGKITKDQAENISKDVSKFRNYLIDLAGQKNIIGAEAIDARLLDESLRVIRPINELHENHDYSVRFKSAEDLTAKELYAYMVYSQEEIFTSTFNGFYERMMKRMKEKDTYAFLQAQNFNKYRTFIKMLAGYNQLDDFLNHMSDDQQKQLLTKFVSNLEDGTLNESLTSAVDVADTFGSIYDKNLKEFFTTNLSSELKRVESQHNQHGIRLYSLLNVILAQSDQSSDAWIDKIVSQYSIPKINELDYSALKNSDGKVIMQVFFFDDDDGKASYNSWIPAYTNSNWNIQDKKTYVLITSAKKDIEIYANKPKYEFEGKDDVEAVFRQKGITPSVVIHRGHSFYVDTTIESLTPVTKLVFLGSCGGYHKLTSVLQRSPEVQIISSKQIGTMAINDPLIRLINSNLLKNSDIRWQSFWNTLDKQIKATGSQNYERFKDYIPPHQNLGAIFIMAYNRLRDGQYAG